MNNYFSFILVVLILCCSCSEQTNQESQPEAGHTALGTSAPPVINPVRTDSLQYLTRYIGQNPDSAGLWETEPLKSKLEELLQGDLPEFLELMKGSQSLKQERVLYTISENEDPDQRAFLIIDLDAHTMHVSIMKDGTRRQYQTPGEQLYMPYEIEQIL